MKKSDRKRYRKKIIESTLDSISVRQKSPIYVFILLLVLYLTGTFLVSLSAGLQGSVQLFGHLIPINAFAGVFSALANICVILMTLWCGRLGYVSALTLLVAQLPGILIGVIRGNNIRSLPGIFSNLLAMIAITVVYLNNKKVEQAYISLRDRAVKDDLTGLPNRFACSTLLKNLISRDKEFALVWIDINNFNSINDSMGYENGNLVLREIASRWEAITNSDITETTDFIARIGGDEFALVICDYSSEEDILKTISRYEEMLGERLTVDSCDFYLTGSFGYAKYPEDGKTNDKLGSCANAAMQEVKRINSSSRILRFAPDMANDAKNLETERLLRAAIENDNIFFHLQPQFDFSHKLRGFEALARMKDPDGNMVSPGIFIPVAEKVGLIDLVDAIVFRKSALFFGKLIKEYNIDITLSVNVSVRHLMKNGFLDEIKDIIKASDVAPEQIEVEITESIMIDSVDKAVQVIDELKKLGIKIAIDDFGTGYSSLSYLNRFPANLLKIDKSFVDKMNLSDSSKQYVAAIVSIGHIMGFDVIAEGVEEQEQLDTLKTVGCDFVQGYIWGRPLPEEEARKVAAEKAV
ncbi:diguanylate cyclase (GGDEF) domain-containing protein [Eubacterium ruminantium]|nr:diguanylate cyclase (GGDEF) domain-containing protein [Eubacterium ruminantium]